MSEKTTIPEQNVSQIMEYLPHRYPFLMIDKVTDIVPFKQAVGMKCVTVNEPYFVGHFPHEPIMPGVMIIEAMAQTAAILIATSEEIYAKDKLIYFVSLDKTRFRKPVGPGEVVYLHIEHTARRSNIWSFLGQARVDGTLVAESTFKATLRDNK